MLISGKYEVQSQLGQGGMGVVYKVRHIALETISALKVLPTHLMENPDLVKRFYREARVMAQLHHPNIVRVIDIHRDDALNFHYFVMEYIQGRTLRKYLQEKGPLSLREVIEIIRQIADALDYAHSYNPPVIHRDIKPTNIMIEDGSQRVVVMDFGIAKELDESEMTRAGIMLGTLKYCPPEQMRHEPLDGSADVYALGMVMYEAYTGTHLFAGLDENDVVRKVLGPEEYKLPFTRPTPAEFIALVTKAIAKTRTSRYRRMADLLGDLGTCWSALDKTKSVILPVAPVSDSGSGGGHDDLMVLEEQIHKLEEERERRRVLRLEAQVQESKQKAAREGAEQLASTLFQQGCALEERGREYWGQRQYDPARKAYEEAASLFGQACEKAISEALVQQAGQARQEMAAVKHEADYYGAKERARSFYSRGLMLQAQAEELWEHQSYREAWQVYGEARSVFKDAHELAYRSLLEEEAKAAQHQIKVARELAVKEAADKFASEAFWEAVKSERRADTALGQGEFTQARELYRAALQQYELVQQQARRERQRREVVLAQQQAQQARAKAEAVGAGPEQDAYRQAKEAQGRGDARLQGQDYEQAAQEYEQAHAGYEQAGQEAERAHRRQAAVEARQRLEEVWAKAEQAGAKGRCAEAFAQVEQKAAEGRKREEEEEFAAAAGLYEEVAQALSRLREEAELQAAREAAEAARRRLTEAKERGVGLRAWAQVAWAEAEQEASQAQVAWQGQAYRRAVELYERALQAYVRAEAEAEEERGRQQALEGQRQAEAVQKTAEEIEAQGFAQELYRKAMEAKDRGEQALAANKWQEVTKAFVEARELFARAIFLKAEQARQEMGAAKVKAERQGAQDKAHALYKRALALEAQAERLWERERYDQAAQVYAEVQSLFEEARALTHRETLKQKAEAEQARTSIVREAAVNEQAKEFASEVFWEAVRSERRADTALGQEAFTQARELYRAALQQYELAQRQARSKRHRRGAVSAQQQAKEARTKAEAAGAGPAQDAYRRAREAQGRGDARLQGQDYEQAAQEYEQAHAGYEQAGQEAERARRLQAVVEARQRMEEVWAAAEQAGARGRCAEAFAQVEQKVAEGCTREEGEEFAAAAGLYEEAAQALSRLLEEAKLQAAREEAEAARQRLIEAREHGAALRGWAKAAWKKADKEANQAEAAWQGQAYHRAVKLYERAVQAYGGAEAEALEERGRQRAQEARRQAEEAQKTAEKTQTQRYTQALYERAQEARRQGEQGLTAKRWEEATNTFIQAKALFDQSLQVAKRAKAGQAAEAAKKSALAAQRKAQEEGASALFPDAFAEAVALLHQAEQKLHQEDYGTAQAIFESSTALFLQICHDAVVSLQREQAQQARARAYEFQGRSSSVKKRQQRRAHKALDQGERLFQQGSFAEARVKYEEAISVLSAVLETTLVAPAERKSAFVSRPYFYGVSILALLSVVIVIYWVSLTPYREPLPKTGQPPPEVKPSVVWWTPELEHELTLAEGQSQTFSVKATSPKNIPLRYAWFLNGEKKAEGEQWTYQPDFTEAGAKPKEVTAIVTDMDNHVVQKSWRVRVRDVNRRPTIQDVSPQIESVEMAAGDSREFSVRASDPDIDNHLLYVWSLDGKKVAEGERWQFRAFSPKLSHKVSVEVVDQAGLKDQRAWDISVKAPLPSLTLPEIVQASPEVKQGEEITVAEGQNQTFAVKAESPQKSRLNYAWFLNGKKKVQGAQWTYQPNFAEAEKKAKEVKVVITDQEDRKAEKIWQVRVQDVNRPPDIGVASPPPTDPVRMAGGGVQSFSVEVSDPDKDDNLVYRWLFDGQEVGRSQSWQLHAPSSEGKHTVEVKVSDKAGLTVQQAWNIVVQAPSLPPVITAAMPSAKIVGTEAGQSLDFSVAADLPGGMHESGKTLRYQWSIDNAAPQITPTGQFRFIETNPGTHQLTVVAISPEGLKSAPQSWSVEVRPQDIGIREAEVRNWLETYRRAWEEKNIESLVKLGESSQHAAKLREVLHVYKDFRVAFQDVKIRIAGNQATVTFSRVDTIDGQTLPQPDRKVITLEKQGDGRIVRRTAM